VVKLGLFRTLIGGTIGLVAGGPLGMVAGAVIANDRNGGCTAAGDDVGE